MSWEGILKEDTVWNRFNNIDELLKYMNDNNIKNSSELSGMIADIFSRNDNDEITNAQGITELMALKNAFTRDRRIRDEYIALVLDLKE